MEDILQPIYQQFRADDHTLGMLLIEAGDDHVHSLTNNTDAVLMVIVRQLSVQKEINIYQIEDYSCGVYVIGEELLTEKLKSGTNQKLITWIDTGKVVFNYNGYMDKLKEQVRLFPKENRDLRMLKEFGELIRHYRHASSLYDLGHYMDAYSSMVQALHGLARLAIIENGYYPEVMVWKQVRQIEPEVFSLYNELIESDEGVKEKIELMELAVAFSIRKRAVQSTDYLLSMMYEEKSPWTYTVLMNQSRAVPLNMILLNEILSYLVDNGIVQVEMIATDMEGIYQRAYRVAEEIYS